MTNRTFKAKYLEYFEAIESTKGVKELQDSLVAIQYLYLQKQVSPPQVPFGI